MQYSNDNNDDNSHDHYHHRGDNGGNYIATFLNISPTSSAATAHISVAVLAVNTKVKAPAVDTTVEAIVFSVSVQFLHLLLTLLCML
jgi:hypothetical protein